MKKNILIIFAIILIVSIGIGVRVYINTDTYKIKKADKLYGNEICPRNNMFFYEDKDHSSIGATVLSGFSCRLCGKYTRTSTTTNRKICDECVSITGRCSECGKLIDNITNEKEG